MTHDDGIQLDTSAPDPAASKYNVAEILRTLGQFSGSEEFYRVSRLSQYICTEGIQYLREACGAYWLTEAIASHQLNPKVRREDFQVWKLRHTEGSRVVLWCEDGNYRQVVKQDIPYSDFPLPNRPRSDARSHPFCIEIWLEGGTTLLLPGEH